MLRTDPTRTDISAELLLWKKVTIRNCFPLQWEFFVNRKRNNKNWTIPDNWKDPVFHISCWQFLITLPKNIQNILLIKVNVYLNLLSQCSAYSTIKKDNEIHSYNYNLTVWKHCPGLLLMRSLEKKNGRLQHVHKWTGVHLFDNTYAW